jgi:hypothetical protein
MSYEGMQGTELHHDVSELASPGSPATPRQSASLAAMVDCHIGHIKTAKSEGRVVYARLTRELIIPSTVCSSVCL